MLNAVDGSVGYEHDEFHRAHDCICLAGLGGDEI
jgi:hypothetical protein